MHRTDMTSGPSTIARPACPYLGTTYDATVHCGYATRENVCYATARRQTISLEFQESYCLGGPYEDCVRYHAAQTGATASQPVETVASFDEPDRAGGIPWRPLGFGIAGVVLLTVLALLLLRPGAAPASPSAPVTSATVAPITPTTLALALVEATAAPTAAHTSTPAPTATRPQLPTATPTRPPTFTPTWTATAAAPTVTVPAATITPTIALTGPYLITANVVNVREGPGLTYRVLGVLQLGQQWPVRGRNAAGDWVQGCCMAGIPGWITTQFITVSVPIADLPIVSVPVTVTVGITATATITP